MVGKSTSILFYVAGFLYNAQDMLLYHPEQPDNARIYVESPAVMGLPFENIFIKTSDGVSILVNQVCYCFSVVKL